MQLSLLNYLTFIIMINGLKQRILVEERNLKQIFPEETLNTVLESDQVDAIFAYKHEAISRSFPYITLPLTG